jgi:uncharacterized phage protein gp47/JayE
MAEFDYTSRDYLTIRQDLLDRANIMIPEWSSRNRADFGVVLVDLWAYMGDVLHYYVDRAASETYLNTATQTSSVLAIANLLDYRPLFQTSSTGTVTIEATSPTHSNTYTIPAGTGFIAPATDNNSIVYFTSTSTTTLGPSVPFTVVSVAEGELITNEKPVNSVSLVSGISNGLAGQRFNLRYTGVVASSVEVFVKEGTVVGGQATTVQYFYTSNLANVSSSSRNFTLETSADGVTQVIFGNNVNGKIPSNGAEIMVSYRKGIGFNGNIEAGRVSAFSNYTVDGLNVVASSTMTGGADAESIDSMRANIPLMFRTQDRAVSVQDFKDLALRSPQVAKATCNAASAPNIMIYALGYEPDYLNTTTTTLTTSTEIRNSIIEYFSTRTVVGASVGVSPTVTLQPIDITVNVQVQNQYVAQWVKDAVKTAIDTFFTFDAVSFGQVLSLGSLYRAIQNIEGVDFATVGRFRFNGVTAQEVYTTLTANSLSLIRRGTINVTTTGGITGILV